MTPLREALTSFFYGIGLTAIIAGAALGLHRLTGISMCAITLAAVLGAGLSVAAFILVPALLGGRPFEEDAR